jgi:hypothetical protein
MIEIKSNIIVNSPKKIKEIVNISFEFENLKSWQDLLEVSILELELLDKITNKIIKEEGFEKSDSYLKDIVNNILLNEQESFSIKTPIQSFTVNNVKEEELDIRERTYIVNKETNMLPLEIAIYEQDKLYAKKNKEYKSYNVENFMKKHKIYLKDLSLLSHSNLSLNGKLGKFVDYSYQRNHLESDVTNKFDSGIEKINLVDFENNLNFFVNDKINDFKSQYKKEHYEEVLKNGDDNSVRYNESESCLVIDYDNALNLKFCVKDIDSALNAEFISNEVFLHSKYNNKKSRIRSVEETVDDSLYMDSSVSYLNIFLKEYIETKIKSERVSKLSFQDIVEMKDKNKDILNVLIEKNAKDEIKIETSYNKQTSQIDVLVYNQNIKSNLAHKLHIGLNKENELSLDISEGKMISNTVDLFLKKSNSFSVMNKIVEFVNNNESTYKDFFENQKLITEYKLANNLASQSKKLEIKKNKGSRASMKK